MHSNLPWNGGFFRLILLIQQLCFVTNSFRWCFVLGQSFPCRAAACYPRRAQMQKENHGEPLWSIFSKLCVLLLIFLPWVCIRKDWFYCFDLLFLWYFLFALFVFIFNLAEFEHVSSFWSKLNFQRSLLFQIAALTHLFNDTDLITQTLSEMLLRGLWFYWQYPIQCLHMPFMPLSRV